MGSNLKLPKGDVCGVNNRARRRSGSTDRGCNERLSGLDEVFLNHGANSAAALMVGIQGRASNPKSRIPKKGGSSYTKLEDEPDTTTAGDGRRVINMMNHDFLTVRPDFLQAWHKCVANICCAVLGSREVRLRYGELLEFVETGQNPHSWTYALSPTLGFICPQQPNVFFSEVQASTGEKAAVVMALLASGFWIGCPLPGVLEPALIEACSSTAEKLVTDSKMVEFFSRGDIAPEPHFGGLRFSWSGCRQMG